MGTHRAKPVEVEAFKLTEGKIDELKAWMLATRGENVRVFPAYLNDRDTIMIRPAEGAGMVARVGDWVVKNPTGEYAVYEEEVFRGLYEEKEGKS